MGENPSVLYRQQDLLHRILRDKQHSSASSVDSADFGDSVGLPDIFYVDSGAGSDVNDGRDPAFPLASIDGAVNKCTASQGDVILVQPGHAETLTTQISLDVIGVSIIGVGEGTLKPQLTINAVIDGIDIGAANCRVENIGFAASTAGATSQINVDAADAVIKACHFNEGASDILGTIDVTANGEVCTIEDCTVIVTANGPTEWIDVEGVVDRLTVRNNHVVASDGTNAFDTGIINAGSVAVTNLKVYGNDFSGGGVATIAVVGTALVAPMVLDNQYSGLCVEGLATDANFVPGLGYRVQKTATLAASGAADDLFDVTGMVYITLFVGIVTTQNAANTDLTIREKTGSFGIAALTVIDSDNADTVYTVTGDASQTLNGGAAPDLNYAGNEGQNQRFLFNGDTIEARVDGGTGGTGVIDWTIFYYPINTDARVVASA